MKISKFDYTLETVIIASGVVIAIFPEIIYKIFSILGILVVLFNVAKFVLGKLKKAPEYPIPSLVFGILLGIFVAIIPNMIEFSLPVILGGFALLNGIERLIRAYQINSQGGNFKSTAIIGGIFSIIGIIMLINPFGTSAFIRRILGICLIAFGVMRIVSDVNLKKQKSDIIPDIIDGDFTSNP